MAGLGIGFARGEIGQMPPGLDQFGGLGRKMLKVCQKHAKSIYIGVLGAGVFHISGFWHNFWILFSRNAIQTDGHHPSRYTEAILTLSTV
jgi:hypothetical protein